MWRTGHVLGVDLEWVVTELGAAHRLVRVRVRVGVRVGVRARARLRVRVTLRPCEPAGRYESRLTQWKASMWMTHGETKYIPLSLVLRAKPISLLRSMPSTTHRSSMKGQSKLSPGEGEGEG